MKSTSIPKSTSSFAKSEDGTIQITITIPVSVIQSEKAKALQELRKEVEIPGFRVGHAPLDKIVQSLAPVKIIELTLKNLLPKLYSLALDFHKIKPAIYPKFELLKVEEGNPWEIRATTCELPPIDPKNYKSECLGALRSASLKKELSKEEKESLVIKTLLSSSTFEVPKAILESEVDSRLSALLSRLESLGLTLEGYLSSTKKTAEALRKEYENRASESIKLDLILAKVAESENVSVDDQEVEKIVKASPSDQTDKNVIHSLLRKKATLDRLTNLM